MCASYYTDTIITEYENLWNNLEFCLKRREEQLFYLKGLYERMYNKEITAERFKELWPGVFHQLVRFRDRITELRKL